MNNVVLVLRKSNKFTERDVELLAGNIRKRSNSVNIFCLADVPLNITDVEVRPMMNDWQGTWSRMELYSPLFYDLRPFLFVDLDTAIFCDLGKIIENIPDKTKYIPLEDFYQPKQLATGLLWMPKENEDINKVWIEWLKSKSKEKTLKGRMDVFLRRHIKEGGFFQNIVEGIYGFKPKKQGWLDKLPEDVKLVCFHGKPTIWEAAKK